MARVQERVEGGLLQRGRRDRANYRVTDATKDSIAFESADVSTGINLGLNEVTLIQVGPNRIRYEVRFRTWGRYVYLLSGSLGLLGTLGYLLSGTMRSEVWEHGTFGFVFYWSMIVFWGLCWPAIMIAAHKGPATRFLEQVLTDELSRRQVDVEALGAGIHFALHEASGQTLCPYCRDDLDLVDPALTACDSCRTVHHQACYAEAQGCTIFACPGGRARQPRRVRSDGKPGKA